MRKVAFFPPPSGMLPDQADLGVSQPAAPGAGPCRKGAASLGAAPPSSFILLLPPLPLWFQHDVFLLSLQARVCGDLPIPPPKAP